jgi:hypothetical protein
MMGSSFEQRNPYQGTEPRAWITVRLNGPSGNTQEWNLLADTGSPFSLIIAESLVPSFTFGAGKHASTNFGFLQASWFQLAMPELGLESLILGYGSEEVVAAAKANHSDFAGLAGLPLLRLLEYGGNADEFWIRRRS